MVLKKQILQLNCLNKFPLKMKTLIYFLIINTLLLGKNLTETKELVVPVVNLQDSVIDNQISFLGFEGAPGRQKKAKIYSVTDEGQLIENKSFIFEIAENTNSTFFSAHYGKFISPENNSLVILVSDPTTGSKAYVWTNIKGEFKREYQTPYIINPQNKKSLPVSSKTNVTSGKEEIIISFGSPNRNITKLNFLKDEIIKEENIAKKFLQNQAGSIYFLNNEEKKELIVFNGGNPTQSRKFINNEEQEKTINNKTQGKINEVFFINEQPALLTNFNKLYLYNSQKTINLNPLYKHKKFISNKANKITFIDSQGAHLVYEIIEDQANLINKEKSPFADLKNIKKTESLRIGNQTIHTAQTKEKNYFIITGKKKKPGKTTKQTNNIKKTKIDTVILTANKEEYIPIDINNQLDFLKLTIEEKPETLELNLDSMAFVWKPLEIDAGNNTLKYNIIYNTGKGSITKEKLEGTTTLTKSTEKEEYANKKILYVNVVPTISTEKTEHKVHAGHTLEIPFKMRDLNPEQKILFSYAPQKENIEVFDSSLKWTPKNNQHGNHVLTLKVKDKYSENTIQNTVFVDTTKQIKTSSSDFILTVNKEFIHDASIDEGKTYSKIKGPENVRISTSGKVHWIPIITQLGNNDIVIERKNNIKTENYIIKTFVNAPPVISFRPDKTEYINLGEDFIFQLKSFDSNNNQKIFWNIESQNEEMVINDKNIIEWQGNKPDYNFYTVTATDKIDTDVFEGKIYVNDQPVIKSTPDTVVQIGKSYNYEILAEDKNTKSPKYFNKENELFYVLQEGPETMSLNNNTVFWIPSKEHVGAHNVSIAVLDGLAETKQSFVVNVNDLPEFFSPDSIKILVGDTLNHFIDAKDNNTKTKLTYSIRTTVEEMYLNANTGKITWIPKEEDLGEHIVEVAVSDGFEAGTNMQKITIFVEKNPQILNTPPTEAYVGLEYMFILEAEDASGNREPGVDVFAKIDSSSFVNSSFDSKNFIFETTPLTEDIGNQSITVELYDKKDNKIQKTFNILVLENSPCDPEESTKEENKKETPEKKDPRFKRIYKIITGIVLGGGIIYNNQ